MAFIKYLVDIDLNKNQLTQAALQNLVTAPGSPATGQIYWDTVLDTARVWDGSAWLDLGSDGITNLGYTASPTDGTVSSDTGTDATIPAGSGTNASLMLPGDKTKLDGIESGANVTDAANVDAAGAVMNSDTTTASMSFVIDEDAMTSNSATKVPTQQSVKAYVDAEVGAVVPNSPTALSTGTVTNTTYGINSDGSNNDVILAAATTSASGVMTGTDKTKLNSIETGADVTDATNVNAAGAVMESDISATPSGRIIDDNTMGTASQTTLATSASIKAYVDSVVAGGMIYKGGYDAATNSPLLDSTPITTAIGDTYTVTAAGTFFTEDVQVGDLLVSQVANAASLSDWTIVNKNIPDIVSASETEQGIVEIATQGEVDTGTDTTRVVTPATLKGTLGVTGSLSTTLKYTSLIGDGTLTTIAVTHNIGEEHVQTQIFDATTGDLVICEVENTSVNTTTFKFNTAPALNSLRVVIIG